MCIRIISDYSPEYVEKLYYCYYYYTPVTELWTRAESIYYTYNSTLKL